MLCIVIVRWAKMNELATFALAFILATFIAWALKQFSAAKEAAKAAAKAFAKAKENFIEAKDIRTKKKNKKKESEKVAKAIFALFNPLSEAEIVDANKFLSTNAAKAFRKVGERFNAYEFFLATRDNWGNADHQAMPKTIKKYEYYKAKHDSAKAEWELAVKLVNICYLDEAEAANLKSLVRANAEAAQEAFIKADAAAQEAFIKADAAYTVAYTASKTVAV